MKTIRVFAENVPKQKYMLKVSTGEGLPEVVFRSPYMAKDITPTVMAGVYMTYHDRVYDDSFPKDMDLRLKIQDWNEEDENG